MKTGALFCFLIIGFSCFSQQNILGFDKPNKRFHSYELKLSSNRTSQMLIHPAHWMDYPDSPNNKRLFGVTAGAAVITVSTLMVLNEAWYKNFPKSEFHTFNDWGEWEGIDKFGHAFSSYCIGVLGYNSLKWSGVNESSSLAFGATWGFVYQTIFEIMDGYNAQWGFSWGDMAANTLGTALFIGQQIAWREQRITPKFSFHATQYPQHRPKLLGENFGQQILKDYNGQTYWLSTNIHSFLNKGSKFPKWISVSLGYGADGMIGGESNPSINENGQPLPSFERYSQFYFSLDIDLHRIKTKSRFVNTFLASFGLIKFPFPTLEFNKNGMVFHPIYF